MNLYNNLKILKTKGLWCLIILEKYHEKAMIF